MSAERFTIKSQFSGCSGLARLDVPEGLERVEGSAFAFCTALERAMLPQSLTHLMEDVFRGCAKIERLVLPGGGVRMGDKRFLSWHAAR